MGKKFIIFGLALLAISLLFCYLFSDIMFDTGSKIDLNDEILIEIFDNVDGIGPQRRVAVLNELEKSRQVVMKVDFLKAILYLTITNACFALLIISQLYMLHNENMDGHHSTHLLATKNYREGG